jgi:hypothetical protein
MTRDYITIQFLECYKTATNCKPDKEEKMILDWLHPKKTYWSHREVNTRLEPPRGSKARPSQKDLEEDGQGSGENMERG